jgi:simple sugar transport system permease protein
LKQVVLIIACVVAFIGMLVLGGISPIEAAQTLFTGSLGSPRAISGSLKETTPLLLAGLGVFFALRAGLFNIGIEGQFLLGGFASALVALAVPGPAGLLLAMVAGIAAGALWALPAGWIRAYRNGHEVITTIMLNSVAVALTDLLVAGPARAANQTGATTATIPTSGRLPALLNSPPWSVSSGLLLGLILCGVMAWWMKRRVAGYELQAVGANPSAAEFAGINVRKVRLNAMLISGAIGGLGGAIQTLAFEGRFYQGFSPGYGFDSLGVALLAGSNALLVVPMSLLFGVLSKGGTSLLILGVPKGLTNLVAGLVILISATIRYRRQAQDA